MAMALRYGATPIHADLDRHVRPGRWEALLPQRAHALALTAVSCLALVRLGLSGGHSAWVPPLVSTSSNIHLLG